VITAIIYDEYADNNNRRRVFTRSNHGRGCVRRVDDVQRIPPPDQARVAARAPPAPAAVGVPTTERHDGIRAARARPHGLAAPSPPSPPPAPGHGHASAPSRRPGSNAAAAAAAAGQAGTDRRSAGHVSDAGHVHRSGAAGRHRRQLQRPETRHQVGNGREPVADHRSTVFRYIIIF